MTSAPLVVVAPTLCPREMKPGQVKRVSSRGPLVGYHIACPCGWRASYLDSEVGFVEEQVLPDRAFPKRLVRFKHPPTCLRCNKRIELRDGRLEAP